MASTPADSGLQRTPLYAAAEAERRADSGACRRRHPQLQRQHMTARTRIVRIGNSRGIRVPKILLDQAQPPDEVELHAEPGRLVVQAPRRPRAGWAERREPCPRPATTTCSMSRRRPGSIVRNGSGGNAGSPRPWRWSPDSARSNARQRDQENPTLSRLSPNELNEHYER